MSIGRIVFASFDGFLGKISYGLAINGWMAGCIAGVLAGAHIVCSSLYRIARKGEGKTRREDLVPERWMDPR